jgi:metal-responsive CopG/Arc/MetJ family transcriptional regulator
MLARRLCVNLPAELAERLDEVVEFFDFGSEEMFVEVAVRRLLDDYTVLAGKRARMMT